MNPDTPASHLTREAAATGLRIPDAAVGLTDQIFMTPVGPVGHIPWTLETAIQVLTALATTAILMVILAVRRPLADAEVCLAGVEVDLVDPILAIRMQDLEIIDRQIIPLGIRIRIRITLIFIKICLMDSGEIMKRK
ncbi:MAG: hypothetical protein LQ352_006205 [Teloschistes flavicans]|nr:MAG: hypothetical protein LQ352_006205 [Teloschistes flavicans]